MPETFNIYCDESCHLENDHQKAMVLGAIWCPVESIRKINENIREIKKKHNIHPFWEIKWVNVSPGKIDFYIDIIRFFFNNEELHFRAIVIPDKNRLNHALFNQTHDDWYYKMYFRLIKAILQPHFSYNIYLDYKDTRGGEKIQKLNMVLSNSLYDFDRKIINRIQLVSSKEIEIMGLADLIIGAVSYVNRDLSSSHAKLSVINKLRELSGYSLQRSTLLREDKMNIFIWQAAGVSNE